MLVNSKPTFLNFLFEVSELLLSNISFQLCFELLFCVLVDLNMCKMLIVVTLIYHTNI